MPGLLCLLCLLLPVASTAAESSSVTVDAQIQQLKSRALQLSAQLSRIEQQLLYPADTQLTVFLSMAGDAGLRLQSAWLAIDGQRVTTHIYTDAENRALLQGGIQRLYAGNVLPGERSLQWHLRATDKTGQALQWSQQITVHKGKEAAFVEARMQLQPDGHAALHFNTN